MGWISVGCAFIAVLAAADVAGKAGAASYVVGDSFGWGVPAGGPATYTTWASQHSFRVGDVLVFNFGTGMHDVALVTKAAYDGCTSTNPIALQTAGPASLAINSTGELYYICTFGQHCPLGQKLAINVTAASPTAPAPTPPSSSPSPMPYPVPSSSPSPVSMTLSPGPSGTTVLHPPSPASESSPELSQSPSTLPAGGLTPPPSPSAATVSTICTPFVIIAMTAYAFLI